MRDDLQLVQKIEGARVPCFLNAAAGSNCRSYLHPFLLGYSSSLVFYFHSLHSPHLSNSHSPHFPHQTAAFRVTQHTIEYCFRKAGYGHGQLSGVSDIVMRHEDDDDAFQHDWQKFSGMDNEKFDYASVDSHLATSSVNTVEELY
jgi:hypothetical protein